VKVSAPGLAGSAFEDAPARGDNSCTALQMTVRHPGGLPIDATGALFTTGVRRWWEVLAPADGEIIPPSPTAATSRNAGITRAAMLRFTWSTLRPGLLPACTAASPRHCPSARHRRRSLNRVRIRRADINVAGFAKAVKSYTTIPTPGGRQTEQKVKTATTVQATIPLTIT
jgi:hypothetical protein